jgi:hypothetical protein
MKPIPRSVFLSPLYSAALVLLAGCGRSEPALGGQTSRPAPQVVSPAIYQLFKAHAIDCRQKGNWIEFPNPSGRASGAILEKSSAKTDLHSVQLDFQMELDSGQNLIESVTGIGESREKAIDDAVQSFALNSFQVILAAFFAQPGDQVRIKNWSIGGIERRVFLGPIGLGGNAPDPSSTPVDWFTQVEEKLKSINIDGGTHWISVYYEQIDNHLSKMEVLLDNDVWEAMQKDLATVHWPKGNEFLSLRVFVVIQDK